MYGYELSAAGTLGKFVVSGNVAQKNRAAAQIFHGTNIIFRGNVIDENLQGMFISGTGLSIDSNTVSNSFREGFIILPDTQMVSFPGNSVIGNGGPGITLLEHAVVRRFIHNNIFANGSNALSFTGEPPNCGVLNGTRLTVQAADNYWGSPTGPGPDPADDAQACNVFFDSTTIVQPAAPSAFGITRE